MDTIRNKLYSTFGCLFIYYGYINVSVKGSLIVWRTPWLPYEGFMFILTAVINELFTSGIFHCVCVRVRVCVCMKISYKHVYRLSARCCLYMRNVLPLELRMTSVAQSVPVQFISFCVTRTNHEFVPY